MIVPTPVQAAMVAALDDDDHEKVQRERYARRRDELAPALRAAGFAIDDSEAGLYLWATRGEPCSRQRRVVGRAGASWWRPVISTARAAGSMCGLR